MWAKQDAFLRFQLEVECMELLLASLNRSELPAMQVLKIWQ
jgi:hypothetical protein